MQPMALGNLLQDHSGSLHLAYDLRFLPIRPPSPPPDYRLPNRLNLVSPRCPVHLLRLYTLAVRSL
jgi:hypothetical protein